MCEQRCIEFLRKFELFDNFFVDVVGKEIALGSFRELGSLLTMVRGLSKPFLRSRLDNPSATSVSWAIVRPRSSEFLLPGVRSNVRGGAMGRSLSICSYQTRCYVVRRRGNWRYQAKSYVSPVRQCAIFWTYLQEV